MSKRNVMEVVNHLRNNRPVRCKSEEEAMGLMEDSYRAAILDRIKYSEFESISNYILQQFPDAQELFNRLTKKENE